MKFSGNPLSRRCVLKFVMISSNNVLEEVLLSTCTEVLEPVL